MNPKLEFKISQSPPPHALIGGGKMGDRIRAYDWAQTPLGPIERWPQSLVTIANTCLNSRFPFLIWWGPSLTVIYNDAYAPIFASKHPSVLGQPGIKAWGEPDVWRVIEPMLQQVLDGGEATWSEDQLLLLHRRGFLEETYFTWSYSPISAEGGRVGGVLTSVTEVTKRVLGERRLRTLRELGNKTTNAKSVKEACQQTQFVLSFNPADSPFTAAYLVDPSDRSKLYLRATTGVRDPQAIFPELIDLNGAHDTLLGLIQAASSKKRRIEIEDPGEVFGKLPGGLWEDSPRLAVLLSIGSADEDNPAGIFIAGTSPRLAFDDDYRGFFDLTVGQFATAIATARAYEEEKKRAEALAAIDRAKTQFFSNVSHEFRTPLTLMLGPLEDNLADAKKLPDAIREREELIYRNALRLLKLVNSLLDFSRIEAGRISASYRPTDLAALTADLASLFRSAMEKAGLEYRVNISTLQKPVYVDSELWEKIVLNLLSNALKYTVKGKVWLYLRQRDDKIQVLVRDTGVGIRKSDLPKIFQRFHRVEAAGGRSHEGSGIGLALVLELVKLHGGSIRVRSRLNKGSIFTVSIPFGKHHLPAEQVIDSESRITAGPLCNTFVEEALRWLPETKANLSSPETRTSSKNSLGGLPLGIIRKKSYRILLADDNADMRSYLRSLLSEYWTVEVVADGSEALARARKSLPDLVVSDVMMPKLDGFELLRALRSDPRTKSLPVVLLSARAGEEATIEGLRAGADDYLVKPFSAKEVIARVNTQLRLLESRKEVEEAIHHRDEFLSIASHELKTPITSLKLQLQMTKRKIRAETTNSRLDEKFVGAMDLLLRQSDRLTGLVEDLLDISRIQAGKLAFQFETVNLYELLKEVIDHFQDQLQSAKCSVILEADMGLMASLDRSRMEQVLINLLSNAVKYAAGSAISIRAEKVKGKLRITMRDSGPGIAKAHQQKIFERFERASASRNISGLGLGLYIVRQIVEGHGGTIGVQSEPGLGTSFEILLPEERQSNHRTLPKTEDRVALEDRVSN